MEHSGEISKNTVWKAADGPHFVVGRVMVNGPSTPNPDDRSRGGGPVPRRRLQRNIDFWGSTSKESRISHSTFEHCGSEDHGCVQMIFGASVIMQNVTVDGSASHGIFLEGPASAFGPGSVNVSVHNSAATAISIDPAQAVTLPRGGTFVGNQVNAIHLHQGEVTRSGTWPNLGVPYVIAGRITVSAPNTPILTLEPGTQLRFAPSTYLEIARGSSDTGGLVAVGTAEAPIVFTANAAHTPVAGYWKGSTFGIRGQRASSPTPSSSTGTMRCGSSRGPSPPSPTPASATPPPARLGTTSPPGACRTSRRPL